MIVPWVLYQRFGDVGILARQFDSMRAWVDLLARTAGEARLWDTGFQFGDWLDPAAPPDNPGDARTDQRHRRHRLLCPLGRARWARPRGVLGRAEDEAHYLALAAEVRAAFTGEYVTPAGPHDQRRGHRLCAGAAVRSAARRRRSAGAPASGWPSWSRTSGYRISTGFVGTPLICDALCSVGEVRSRLPPAHAARVPLLALPGDHGRHHDLGALGQHAARTARSTPAR